MDESEVAGHVPGGIRGTLDYPSQGSAESSAACSIVGGYGKTRRRNREMTRWGCKGDCAASVTLNMPLSVATEEIELNYGYFIGYFEEI